MWNFPNEYRYEGAVFSSFIEGPRINVFLLFPCNDTQT